jgi:uncharacterized membrane protein
MASSKARSRNSRNRSASSNGGRPTSGAGSNGKSPSSRTVPAASATPASPRKSPGATTARSPRRTEAAPEPEESFGSAARPGPPLWLQITSLVLAVIGLAISAYETYAHYNGSHLAGCPSGAGGTFNCTAVITSSQSMVFNVIPVAVLGLAFYVFAVVIFTPWAWRFRGVAIRLGGSRVRITSRGVDIVRLGSVIVGMGFVMYLIYAEFQIGSVCEYCSGVHLVTFLLFCITVISAALWGLGKRNTSAARS